jgi:hypothetical protein
VLLGVVLATSAAAESAPPAAALPDDLPLYASAIPVSSMASQAGGTVVNLRSTDSPEQIFAWYRDEFPKRGWRVEQQDGASGRHLVTAVKDRRKASVLITGGESGTQILLSMVESR